MLLKTLEEGQFSHHVRRDILEKADLTRQEKAFTERLFYGVLEQVIFLDWIIASYSSVKPKKIKPVIRNILRLSIYQILFMDSVPDHAAINEAAKLAAKRGYKGLIPFVNGLLRAFQRGGIKPGMPEHVKHADPLWLYDLEVKELGKKKADLFFDTVSSSQQPLYARLSLSLETKENICRMLEEDGVSVEEVPEIPEAVRLKDVSDLTGLKAFQEGLIYLQDLSSMQVARAAKDVLKEADHILDVCAAPGGKSLHLAELFPKAKILSRDLTEEKKGLIEENIKRSRLKNIEAEVWDALKPDPAKQGKEDLVLADLPCSGLGVIGRKPEIRLRVTEEDLKELSLLQRQILTVVQEYVRLGGILIYSTCTVDRMENQDNAAWFAENFPFEKLREKQFLPGEEDCDGFYLACFRRKEA